MLTPSVAQVTGSRAWSTMGQISVTQIILAAFLHVCTRYYWHQNRSNFTSLLASQNVWNTGTNAEAWYLAQFIISVGSSNHTWSVNWVSVPVASIHQTEQPDSMWTSLTSNHNIGPGLSRKLFGFLSGNGATWCTVSCSQA